MAEYIYILFSLHLQQFCNLMFFHLVWLVPDDADHNTASCWLCPSDEADLMLPKPAMKQMNMDMGVIIYSKDLYV